MSFYGLALAGKSLEAFQEAANVTSDNIANVNTPGASRQQANITEASPIVGSPGYPANSGQRGTKGDGAIVSSIIRIHQDSYDSLYRGANSAQNYFNVQQQQLAVTQSSFSEPKGGLSTAYTSLQAAISQWAAQPTQATVRQNVLQQAQTFTNSLNTLSTNLVNQQQQVRYQFGQVVQQANGYLDQIAALNSQIRADKAVGNNPNTFLDQRDHLIDQLSQLVSVQTSLQPNGSSLVTVGGRALVNDTIAYHLATPTIPASGPNNGQLIVGFQNDPNPSAPVAVPLGSGQLNGYSDLYNNKLAAYSSQLDQFASATAATVNATLTSGYDLNGNAGTALFRGTTATAAITAGTIQLGIANPALLAGASVSTAAGSLVVPVNSANNIVDPSASLVNNPSLATSPTTALTGAITVTLVDSTGKATSQGTFNYDLSKSNTATGADSINDFLLNFNAAKLGVTATYNSASQTLDFKRDPSIAAGSPNFTLRDSNPNAVPGAAATSLLQTLGAAAIAGRATSTAPSPIPAATAATVTVDAQVGSQLKIGEQVIVDAGTPNAETVTITAANPGSAQFTATFANTHTAPFSVQVVQNNQNAVGPADNSNANALLTILNSKLPVPPIVGAVSATNVPGGGVSSTVTATISGAFNNIKVGQQLYIVDGSNAAGNANYETVTVTAVAPPAGAFTGSFTAIFQNAHTGPFAVAGTGTQSLSAYYSQTVTQLGLDASTAQTGTTTQTSLTNNIDKTRQSIDGINLDEETQHLVQYQNAYQAAAKVFNVLDSLLTTVLTNLAHV